MYTSKKAFDWHFEIPFGEIKLPKNILKCLWNFLGYFLQKKRIGIGLRFCETFAFHCSSHLSKNGKKYENKYICIELLQFRVRSLGKAQFVIIIATYKLMDMNHETKNRALKQS